MFTLGVVVDLPTDCISSFLFAAETDVLVPVLFQSTEVEVDVVNFVAVLKFPNVVVAGTSYQMLEVLAFRNRESS